ncbi:MAG: radical SAM protein, partial [Dehalococcoidales bacterium]|nr:radical SAM protein [Dehalococcoidales bacterium]
AYGTESAAPEMLEKINKGISLVQVEEAVRISREAGLQTIGYFMIGAPGETPETIQQTIRFAKKLKLDFAQFSIATPYPGTELFRMLGERGRNIPWESLTYSGADNKLSPVFESESLSREDLKYWARQAYREFYLRPAYLWQRLSRTRSLGDIKVDFKGLTMLRQSTAKS